ncbi:glycosyltransferase family 2 protein [Priestia aryabhattai]|uniref:glycosyltransferase family A protein n=1 Tax=Priestia aryabhattai TaxID=412384 RepID=UPI001CD66275|nr:glycosyltransferase family A protein [Priestia aryabhattai]MCA1048632.1 glycosyltransferase family 2 protein [Priestia aryabhattai]
MKIEVLVSTMNQNDLSLVDRMNIKGDAIIINQSDKVEFVEVKENNRCIKIFTFNERGIGLSRNTALMRATADICLMADDDVTYLDDYENLIKRAFINNPEADMIIFNLPAVNEDRDGNSDNKRQYRVNYTNFMRYGTIRIAFKRESILNANIYFSLLFGGGAKYGSGEDTLFIHNCLKKGLKIYACPVQIGTVKQEDSSWFRGYNEKYFYDKGVLYNTISTKMSYFLIVQFALRKYSLYKKEMGLVNAIKYMIQGKKERNVSL